MVHVDSVSTFFTWQSRQVLGLQMAAVIMKVAMPLQTLSWSYAGLSSRHCTDRLANSRLLYAGSCLCLERLQLLLGCIVVLASYFADLFQILYGFLVLPSNLKEKDAVGMLWYPISVIWQLLWCMLRQNHAGRYAEVDTEVNTALREK